MINDEMDSRYYETLTITLVMRILKGHYLQNQVNSSHEHKKGRKEGGNTNHTFAQMYMHSWWVYA